MTREKPTADELNRWWNPNIRAGRSARMADEEDAVSDLAWEPDEDETS